MHRHVHTHTHAHTHTRTHTHTHACTHAHTHTRTHTHTHAGTHAHTHTRTHTRTHTHTLIFYLTCDYGNSKPPSEAPGGGEGRFLSRCKGVAVTVTCPQFFSMNTGPIQPSFHQLNNWQGNYSTHLDFQSVASNAENEEEQRVWVRPQERRNQITGE